MAKPIAAPLIWPTWYQLCKRLHVILILRSSSLQWKSPDSMPHSVGPNELQKKKKTRL